MLGDVVCATTPVCQDAINSIQQLDAVYNNASSDVQSQFQSTYNAIKANWTSSYSWWDTYIPFNSNCCTLQSIANQADSLSCQIQRAMGQSCGPAASGTGTLDWSTLLIVGGAIYLGFVYFASHR